MAYFAMIDVEALQEEARLERRTNVGLARQVWAQTLKQRASTMAYMCTACQLRLMDTFVDFLGSKPSQR